MLDPCDSWTISWPFNFLWIFNWHGSSTSSVHPLEFQFTLQSVTTNMAHNGDVAFTTHDTTWHDTADMDWVVVVEMSSYCFYWFMDVILDVLFLHLHMAWCCRIFNGLGIVRWLHACFPFAWASFIHPIASKSSSMFAPSSSHSSSYHDLSTYLFLQFTQDGMKLNPKHPSLRWCIFFHGMGLGQMTD